MEIEEKVLVGKVTHYYPKIGVAVVEVKEEIRLGDEISIEGNTTNIRQKVESMQIEHKPIEAARPGDLIGLKVVDRVRKNDLVYKIVKKELGE
ncbi:MAG: U32 family peptidase C-terminal domain-containing protein [Candidatus Aenigmarchaeota archaeon]|nr:U32 family peptidase C-terminal domain-containing protein [Candidatus Aenigmarchaeota archaeon]